MGFEPGGRADKYGNEYENRFLARLLLRIVNQELSFVIVEPLEEFSDSVEYVTESMDGTRGYYQCKAANASQKSWTFASLRSHSVFKRSMEIIDSNNDAIYRFISPLPYNEIDELCKRARTCGSSDEFIKYELTNKRIKEAFDKYVCELGLDKNNAQDMERCLFLLSHCDFEQVPFTETALQDLEERIGLTFTGSSSEVRLLLEHYVNGNGKYGVKITVYDIVRYLESCGHHLRNDLDCERVLSRIMTLNRDYWGACSGILGKIVHRDTSDDIIDAIMDNYSVVLHGKAGNGKSGCLEEVIDVLDNRGIPYLAIKLDKFTPEKSADQFGQDLELNQSPVYALQKIAAGEQCVLILDQLDALRWTNSHSSTALEVCKELISQANAVNTFQLGKISIVFAARTFDLEYDRGLKSLFAEKGHSPMKWLKLSVGEFTEEEVRGVIGEEFNRLSQRLRKILRTPSSLYVWTQLSEDKRDNNIKSLDNLMSTWWCEIVENCEKDGIANSAECKNRIVHLMESGSRFSLSSRAFSDYHKTIERFKSFGMLKSNTETIEFVHQSFLDYFIANSVLEKLYSGQELAVQFEPSEMQLPNCRYRFLAVLHALVDSDPNEFIRQSRCVLDSEAIHYYIKCGVFEVIGQIEEPKEEIINLVDQYLEQSEWKKYITSVVYTAHPVFIKHLVKKQEKTKIMTDTVLSLLGTVSDRSPDYVVNLLRPYAMKNAEDDRRIYRVLPFDISSETENSFRFRIEILERNPVLLSDYSFAVFSLIERESVRAINLLEIVLRDWPKKTINNIYIGQDSELLKYSHKHHIIICNRLFPLLCSVTKDYLPRWSKFAVAEYNDWIEGRHNNSIYRRITRLTKLALKYYAKEDSEGFCAFVGNINYPLSGIGHELLMSSLAVLSVDYSDFVVSWLLSDFKDKVFVFSDDQSDYLKTTKEIVQKYSAGCSRSLFQRLEQMICNWQDRKEHMIYQYNRRLEDNREEKFRPVYYAYWGHFQKALLPFMTRSRLSESSRSLLSVVNRNEWINPSHYYSGFVVGAAKCVISPVDAHTEVLSDNNWLHIISTPKTKMKNWSTRNETKDYYIEASHVTFASALGRQARKEPERFAKLSLSFPENCFLGYVSNVLYALSGSEDTISNNQVELYSQVIRRYQCIHEANVGIAIVRIVEVNAEANWPNDVLNLIADYAQNHPNPEPNEYETPGLQYMSVESLLTHSINCVRGCALRAIAKLIRFHTDCFDRYVEAISSACSDRNAAVRCAAMTCTLECYNYDKAYAIRQIEELISRDLRLLAIPGIWQVISDTFTDKKEYYRTFIIRAIESDVEDLAVHAAGLSCAIGIILDDSSMMKILLERHFTDGQRNAICGQAVRLFAQEEYHEKSETIIRHLIEEGSGGLDRLSQLFYQNWINPSRDVSFLAYLMKSSQGANLMHSFLRYLKGRDVDIRDYCEAFFAIADSLVSKPDVRNNILVIDDYIQCVIRLFDRAQGDTSIQLVCLEIWDKLFMSDVHGARNISDMLEDIEN